jgi:hypothetical protein
MHIMALQVLRRESALLDAGYLWFIVDIAACTLLLFTQNRIKQQAIVKVI